MITINRSIDSEYYSQRNNRLYPHSACNVTAYTMAAVQAGALFDYPSDMQPEDYFMQALRCKASWKMARQFYPWAFDGDTVLYPPNEIHGMLVHIFNQLTKGKYTARFTTRAAVQDLLFQVMSGAGVVLSGNFPLANGKVLKHMVSLAGFTTKQTDVALAEEPEELYISEVERIIIDDPYGDWRTGYATRQGNNIALTMPEFNCIMKNPNSSRKWAHIIRRIYE